MRPGWRARVAGGLKAHESEREELVGGETAAPAEPAPDTSAPDAMDPGSKEPKAPAQAPQRLGRYELVRELARGGAGVVYLARDERLGREVALKLLRAGEQASPEQLSRFEVEARMAARLRHPGIVAIHEVSEAEGCPFLVMDLVQGESLAERLRRDGALPASEAARLAAGVARALAYAHARGVLHRDVKPGNVLLSREGQPHLTDFGLAKEIDGPAQGPTVTGQVMGTPSYMPPEQASGQPGRVDARSDVYGLGATLYDLLLGRPPYLGRDVMAVLAQVGASDPVPSARALDPRLDRDLDTICARCLEKDPADRYPSAAAVAEDLERWLRHEPILARRPGPAERTRKWLRRNQRLARALGTTLGLALLAGLLATVGFVRRLQAEQRRADGEARIASHQAALASQQAAIASRQAALASEQAALASASAALARRQAALAGETLRVLIHEVRDRLTDIPGREVAQAREKILLQAIAGLERLDAAALADEDRALEASEAWRQVGDIRLLSDRRGLEEAEQAYRRAVEIARPVCARLGGPSAGSAELVSLQTLQRALTSLGGGLRANGKLPQARQALEEALQLGRRVVEISEPGDPTVHVSMLRELALAEERLGMVLTELHEHAGAREHLGASVSVRRRVWEAEEHPRDRLPLAVTLDLLAHLQLHVGQAAQGLATAQEARQIIVAEVERDPSAKNRLHLLEVEQILGDAHERLGQLAEARRALEQALVLARGLVAETPTHLLARRRLAEVQVSLAGLEPAPARGLPHLLAAAQHLRDLEAQVGDPSTTRDLAEALEQTARLHLQEGETTRALALLAEAVPRLRRSASADDGAGRDALAQALHTLGRVRLTLVNLSAAREALTEAVSLRRARLAADRQAPAAEPPAPSPAASKELASSLLALGEVEQAARAFDLAQAAFDEARALLEPLAERDPASYREALGQALERQSALAAARADPALTADALEARLALQPVDPTSPASLRARVKLLQGLAHERLEGDEAARAVAGRLLEEAERHLGALLGRADPSHADRVLAATNLDLQGERLRVAQQFAGSLQAFQRSVALRRELLAAEDERGARRELALALERVGEVARKAGQPREARQALEECLALRRELLARDPGSVLARRDLTAALGGLVNVRQVLNDLPGAVQALSEAVENHRLLVQRAPQYEPELIDLEAALRTLRGRLEGKPAGDPGAAPARSSREQLRLGYSLLERGDDPRGAALAFREALKDPENCADLRESNLYNGACAAALAAAASEGEERAAFLKDAWAWLEDDLERHGRLLGRVQDKLAEPDLPAKHLQELGMMRDFCQRHFAHARQDPDLAVLRREAERFEGLFPVAARTE